ncbi:hypothetical protein V8D89_007785 [Ganoderma adspersum]
MSVNSFSVYSQALKKPAFTVHIEPALYVSGSTIYGELELDVKNRLAPGSHQFKVIANQFLRETGTLWVHDRAAQSTFGGVINILFDLKIPEDAPPSFGRKAKFPVVIVPNDPISNGTCIQLKLGWSHAWGRLKVEDKVRKYPWGEYAHVRMELLIPHVDTFPLFTDIPYTIIITTLSAPTKRKENAGPDKNFFPQVPGSASEIDFEMRRFVDMETLYQPSNPEEHVVDIISKAHAPIPPVVVEMSKHTWIPDEDHEGRGRWRQEATFSSSMNLRYTPTFASEEVKIKYTLFLPNTLRLCMPITIGSGTESSIPLGSSAIDLPA